MSPRLHASARKHFERDRLTDEAVLYAYEHALNSRPLDVRTIPGDGSSWVSTSLDASVVATPVSLALVARWCFTGASRETPALASDLVSIPRCRCYSWPSGTAGGPGRLHGGDQAVDGLGVRCEGIRGSIAPRADPRVTDRAVSVERSIHARQCCATRLLAEAPADLAACVLLGKSPIMRRRSTTSWSNRRSLG